MNNHVHNLIGRYESAPGQLRRMVSGLSSEQLRSRPIQGMWSTLEVVCHLADTEQFFADRMKRAIALPRPLLMGAEPDPYVQKLYYHDRALAEELDLIAVTRTQMARILGLQPDDAWGRQAVHNEAGLVDLQGLLAKAVEHFDHHLGKIPPKRAALGLRPAEV